MSRDPGAALVPISGSGRPGWLGNIVRIGVPVRIGFDNQSWQYLGRELRLLDRELVVRHAARDLDFRHRGRTNGDGGQPRALVGRQCLCGLDRERGPLAELVQVTGLAEAHGSIVENGHVRVKLLGCEPPSVQRDIGGGALGTQRNLAPAAWARMLCCLLLVGLGAGLVGLGAGGFDGINWGGRARKDVRVSRVIAMA